MPNKVTVGVLSMLLGSAATGVAAGYYTRETQIDFGINANALPSEVVTALRDGSATAEQITILDKALADKLSTQFSEEAYAAPNNLHPKVQAITLDEKAKYKALIEQAMSADAT